MEPSEKRFCVIHEELEKELKIRKDEMEKLTGRPSKGGLTTFSQLAGHELRLLRGSKEEIEKILAINKLNLSKEENGYFIKFPYDLYKTMMSLISVLSKKKDNRQIIIDVSKIRGLKKNSLDFFW